MDEEMIGCPFCGETEDSCEHLLSVIDRTFATCEGGYVYKRANEFYTLIENAFMGPLGRNEKMVFSWLEYEENELQQLWDEAVLNSPNTLDYIHIDGDILTRMEIQLLNETGAIECEDDCDGGAPGMSSATSYLYAESPKETFDNAIALLSEKLATGICEAG